MGYFGGARAWILSRHPDELRPRRLVRKSIDTSREGHWSGQEEGFPSEDDESFDDDPVFERHVYNVPEPRCELGKLEKPFRELWPKTSANWKKDWHSFPLAE
jgi:hypothetical protein